MKKIVYILAAMAFVAVGCNKVQPDNNDVTVPEGKVVSFKATIEAPVDADTRASVSTSTGDFAWTDGDKIAVQLTNDNFKEFTYSSAIGEFSATLGEGETIMDGGNAYYPSSIAINGTPGSVRLPASYAAAVAEAGFPMIAPVSLGAGTLAFTHLGGLLTLTVSYVPADAESLVLTVPAVGVTGDFVVSAGKITAGSSASTVTLTFAKGAYAAAAHEFVIPMPVATFSSGFTMQFKNGSDEVLFEKGTSKATIAIGRAAMKKMASITVPKYIYFNTVNPWSGVVANTYVHMYSGETNNGWPGATGSGTFTHGSKTYSRYEIPSYLNNTTATLIFNGGNVTADGGFGVEDFTRATASSVALTSDLYYSLNSVAQEKTKVYFRDNNGQQYNWEYYVYAWNRSNESEKLFGNWPGTGKSTFSWAEIHDDVWYGSFEIAKNYNLGFKINNPGNSNETNTVEIPCTESNYVVVTDNASAVKTMAGFPTVALNQD